MNKQDIKEERKSEDRMFNMGGILTIIGFAFVLFLEGRGQIVSLFVSLLGMTMMNLAFTMRWGKKKR